jgi:hypothetical protein
MTEDGQAGFLTRGGGLSQLIHQVYPRIRRITNRPDGHRDDSSFCLFVASMLFAALAELVHLKPGLDGLFVLLRMVVELFALFALELNQIFL